MEQFELIVSNLWVQVAGLILFATVHGYLGAWIAVRMLFRPRQPFKVFGITLFPQGMIPRHRERLASTIGKAVGEELVSKETVLEELFEKNFLRRKIENLIDSYAQDFLNRDHPTLIEALPSGLREPFLDAVSALQLKIGAHIQGVLKSEETAQSINGFVERRVDEFLSKRVSEVIDEDKFNKTLAFVEARARAIVRQPALEKKISDFIDKQIDSLATSHATLGELFTPDSITLVKEKANEQIEPIVHHLTEIATAKRTRDQIGALVKREVHNYYEQLPFFKKIFVSRENLLGEVDNLVNESLPRRIEETLRGDFFAEEARNFLNVTIDNATAQPLQEVVGKINPAQLESLKAQVKRSVFSLVQGEEMQTSVSAYLTDSLQKIRPHSLDAILQTAHPESEEKLKRMLAKGLLNVLNQEETANIINRVLSRQIERFLSIPIGKLSDHISQEQIKTAGQRLTDTIINAAKEKLPVVIQEFDIGNVVREKINNYPVEKLENLILSVAKEHLRKIELFGAFLGFILGVFQSLFYIFGK